MKATTPTSTVPGVMHGAQRSRVRTAFGAALIAASLLPLMATTSLAQVAPGAEPQKIEERFEVDTISPTITPAPVPGIPIQQPSAGADLVEFTVKNVSISGATVYSEDSLMQLVGDRTGKRMTLAEAQQLANDITRKYRADGYILTQATVTAEDAKSGQLHIRVSEGYVSDVLIEGDHRETRGIIDGYAKRLKAERPLSIKTLERYLLLADDLPGVTAKGVIRALSGQPGVYELVMVLSHDMYSGAVTIDNRGTEFQGPEQYSAQFVANSVLGMYERTQIRGITTTPTTELRFIDIQHEQQLGTDGTRLLFVGSVTESAPGDILGPLNIDGDAATFRARLLHPIMRSRKENLFGRVSFDYRNSNTDALGNQISEDRIRSLRVGAQYDFLDVLRGVNLVDVELSQGLDIMNATDPGVGRSRADGEEDYTKVTMDVARLQNLSDGWSLLAQASGQYAFDPLLSAEEFSLGGADFGRAYDPAELAADHGAAAKLEVRWSDAPGNPFLQSYQLYSYYDIGSVWNKNTPTGTDERVSLASLGAGVRANIHENFSGNFELGMPMTKRVSSKDDRDLRAFFSVTGRF